MVTTRTAKEVDAPGLLVLFQQLGYSVDLDNLQSSLREYNPCRYALIAEVKERLSGVIVVNLIEPMHEKGRWGLISALVIDESCRGMGVGEYYWLKPNGSLPPAVVAKLNSPAANDENRRISFIRTTAIKKSENAF